MERTEVLEFTERSLAELNESLKNGKSNQLTAFLEAMATFRDYSYRNLFLIMKQNPNATHVAGFNAWKKLGRWVKSGEVGIGIIAPMTIRPQSDSMENERLAFRLVHIFDISQTDGNPMPSISEASGDPGRKIEDLEKVYRHLGIYLESVELSDGCSGISSGGHVKINQQLKQAERFQTLVHELAHELLHQNHEAKELKLTRKVKELEAESVAYVVATASGIDCKDASCDYIQLYQGEPDLLAKSLERIRKTAVRIFNLLDEVRSSSEIAEVNHAA